MVIISRLYVDTREAKKLDQRSFSPCADEKEKAMNRQKNPAVFHGVQSF